MYLIKPVVSLCPSLLALPMQSSINELPSLSAASPPGITTAIGINESRSLFAVSPPFSLQVDGQCCEDNPDALTHHELLLPGHLLLKVLKEKLEDCLEALRESIRRKLEQTPETNLEVGRTTAVLGSLAVDQDK